MKIGLFGLSLLNCFTWAGTALAAQIAPAASESELFDTRYKNQIAPLLARYCTDCHGSAKKKGGVRLDEPVTTAKMISDAEKWQTLLEQITTAQMPPEEKPRPDAKDIDAIAKWVRDAIAFADSKTPKDPGYVMPQRLNRTEYNNTVRELTGLDISPADAFPVDDSGYGFDNIADVLTMSPLLAESYLDAAEAIVEQGFNPKPRDDKAEPGLIPARRFKITKEGVSKNDGVLTFYSEGVVSAIVDCVPGNEYELKARAWQDKAGTEDSKALVSLDGKEIATLMVSKVHDDPQTISCRFKATKAKHELTLAFTNDFYDQKTKADRNLYLTKVRINNTNAAAPTSETGAFAKHVLIATPAKPADERAAAETILRVFATRAFRRPVFSDEVTKLMTLYDAGKKGGTHVLGLKRALTAVLVSPSFLFRIQAGSTLAPVAPAAPSTATSDGKAKSGHWAIDDFEIASRLSYFLWSSMPDEKLFKLAEAKSLGDPKVRAEQVRRMLLDPKAHELIENFAGQWLELRNLDELMLSNKRFPDWNSALATSMRKEGEMLFEEIVKEDRSVLEFINADFLYVNGPLAKLYGIKDVTGLEFKRVSAAGTGRGGVLTMASTLAVTSNPTRTSPVKRGKWVLDQILGLPPPPPPPEIPALPDKAEDEANSPLRVRLEKHRADPSCAACHSRLDGYGLALENFDAIGRFREKDGKFPVDAVGQLPGEAPIKGAAGLKELILKHKQQFIRSFSGKLLTYAIGRGLKPYDRPTLNEIVLTSGANEFKFSSVVLAIVESDAFLKRREKKGDEK